MNQQALAPPPRRVQLLSLWKDPIHLGWVLAGVIFLLIATIQGIAFTWISRPWVDHTLDRAGQWTAGELLATEIVTDEHYGSRHPSLFTYRFEVEGSAFDGRSKTLDPQLVPVTDKGELRVRFMPGRPHWNRAEGTRFSLFPRWAFAAPVLMFALGPIFLLTGIRGRAGLRRILERGEEITGVVLELRRLRFKQHTITKQYAHRITFEYRYPGNLRRTGHVDTFKKDIESTLAPGSTLRLLVNRNRPQQVVAVDLIEAARITG